MPTYDINIIPSYDSKRDRSMLSTLAELGYDGMCWNVIVDKPPTAKDKQTPQQPYIISLENDDDTLTQINMNSTRGDLLTTQYSLTNDFATLITSPGQDQEQQTNPQSIQPTQSSTGMTNTTHFQQLKRITIHLSEMNQMSIINYKPNSILSKFDLVAIQPGDEKILHTVLFNDDCDIITFDLSKRLPFLLKPQHIRMAISKSIYFEIDCKPLLQTTDSNIKRTFLSQLQSILFVTRGKQLILSTGANDLHHTRSSSDLLQLFIAIGVPIAHIRDCMSTNIYHCIAHAKTRVVHKAVIQIQLPPSIMQAVNEARNNKNNKDKGDNKKNNNNNNNGENGNNNKRNNSNNNNNQNNNNQNNKNQGGGNNNNNNNSNNNRGKNDSNNNNNNQNKKQKFNG